MHFGSIRTLTGEIMNERIKELYDQCIVYNTHPEAMWGDGPPLISGFNTNKFAELIIKECSKVNNQFVGRRIGDIDLDMAYKEHFGVE